MSTIQAVVFDLDGTLVDTSEFIIQAYEYAIGLHGYEVPSRARIAAQVGKKLEDAYATLLPGVRTDAIIADHALFQSGHVDLIKGFADSRQTIERLRAGGVKCAIWTSRRRYIDESLQVADLDNEIFDQIVSATDVVHGKPNPEGLFVTLKALGVAPEVTILVGDAAVDIEAGHRAGVAATVGIPHGFGTRAELEAAQADYIIDSLMEIPAILDTIEDK